MKALWIRVDANLSGKVFVGKLAGALGVSIMETVGYLVTLWGNVAYHARRGDLSDVEDSLIEDWARWPRKRGKFAAAFRAHCVDPDGRIRDWERYAGHLEDSREREDSPDGKSTYVYYAVDGDRCKIGWSGNPWARMNDMRTARPSIQLAATERGNRDLERERQKQFQDARLEREWFTLTPELSAHIRSIAVAHRSDERSNDRSRNRSTTEPTTDPATVAGAHTRARANGTERHGTGTTPLSSEKGTAPNGGAGSYLDQERSAAPPAPPADARGRELWEHLERAGAMFLRKFYRGAGSDRQADVANQIQLTLSERGARLRRGEYVRAHTVERLIRKIDETIHEGVKDPDKAITVLLIKLGDTSDVSAERVANVERELREAEAEMRDNLENALAWLDGNPEEREAIDHELEVAGAKAGTDAEPYWRFTRNARVLQAWRNAGAPRVVEAAS